VSSWPAVTVSTVWHGEFRHPRLVEVYDARYVTLADGTTVETWGDVASVRDGVVSFAQHYVFAMGTCS
jgi:hypothetical protein